MSALMLALTLACAAADEAAPPPSSEEDDETHVLETRVVDARAAPTSVRATSRSERATATPEDALEALPGVSLTRSGGPLAPARLFVRGLSGPRIGVSVDGMSMTDPVDGALDAAMLPLFFADDMQTERVASFAGLALASDAPVVDLVGARIGVGTLETIDLSGTAAFVDDEDHARLGLRVARTAGDFAFVPRGATGTLGSQTTRDNNDQLRVVGAGHAQAALARSFALDGAFVLAHHEGGVPGFATAPTDGLRAASSLAAGLALARTTLPLDGGTVVVEAGPGLRATSRETRARAREPDALVTTEAGFVGRVSIVDVVPGLDARAEGRTTRSEIATTRFSRTTTAASLFVAQRLFGRALVLSADATAARVSDAGIQGGAGVAAAVAMGPLEARVGLARRTRAPTLDELYAPAGFVEGNPLLSPESLTEVEGGARFFASRIIDANLTLFAGQLDDAILYVNRSAYTIAPINTGRAWRAGAELALTATPHRFLALDTRASALASLVLATQAPLPIAPPFFARQSVRLGAAHGPHVAFVARSRAASSANLYGTLVVAPYTLVDVVASWPLSPALRLTSALTNVFDVQDAQDANLLPLPGRQVFVALEVLR